MPKNRAWGGVSHRFTPGRGRKLLRAATALAATLFLALTVAAPRAYAGPLEDIGGFFSNVGNSIVETLGIGSNDVETYAFTDPDAVVDPDTTNSWQNFTAPGGVTSTQNVGRIWTDKSVFDKDYALSGSDALNGKSISKGDSDLLVGLSALSSTSNLKEMVRTSKPLDIVLVLDTSGSMSGQKLTNLKNAANNFIDATAKNNRGLEQDQQTRLAIVQFASGAETKQGLNFVTDQNAQQYKNTIDRFGASGATYAEEGLQHAQNVLDQNDRGVQQIVIFFTDGEPNHGNGFDDDVAIEAVNVAHDMKASGTIIYSIGVMNGANASVTDDGGFNEYMNAVSSNYPDATADWEYESWDIAHWFGSFGTNLGTRADGDYYKAASDADSIEGIFEEISDEVQQGVGSGSPIVDESEEGNTDPGDLNFTDQLGSYMQVSGDKMTLVFADGIYEGTINDDGTVTFPDETTTANTVYGSAKISDIKVTINKGGDLATGDTVNVTIPASLLPMRNYDVDTDAKSMSVTDAYPVRLFYGVSLKADAKAALSNPTSDTYQAIVASQATDSTIDFYSNNFVEKQADGETTASFEPNAGNKFYYYTQDATLYSDSDCTREATQWDYSRNDTLYWKDTYWVQTKNGAQEVSTGVAVNRGTAEWKAIERQGGYNGTYYIPAGTQRSDRPATLTSQKSENKTETAENVLNPSWAGKNVSQALGNNGKLSFDKPGSLEIKKTVNWGNASDDTKTNHNSFSFDITATTPTGEDGAAENLNGTYNYFVNGAKTPTGTVKFEDGKGTVTMKGGDKLVIEGLPAKASFTVTEQNANSNGFSTTDATSQEGAENDNTKDGSVAGTIMAGSQVSLTFTNTYHASDVNLNTDTTLKVQKNLEGRDWRDGDSFDFTIDGFYAPTGVSEAPEPESTTITVDAADKDANYTASFGDITFSAPGEYRYTVQENSDPQQPIAGIDYSDAIYRVTVMVGDNGTGALTIDSVKIERMNNDDGTVANTAEEGVAVDGDAMTFTNTYKADSATQGIQGKKSYTDTTGGNPFEAGKFTFKLEAQGGFVTKSGTADDLTIGAADTPMPKNAENNAITTGNVGEDFTFPSIVFDGNDVGNTYVYKVTEVEGDEADKGMSYSKAEHTVMIQVDEVTDDDGTHIKATVQGDYVDPSKLVFENEYKPTEAKLEGSSAIHGTKTLTGRDMQDGEIYYFQLTAVDDNAKSVLPNAQTVAVTKDNMKNGSAGFKFDDMSFTKVGTYTFTVNEVADENGTETTDENGMTFDRNVATVEVVVSDAEDGSLKAEVSYSNDKHGDTTNQALFTNVYEASMSYGSEGKGGINVTKTMKDRPMTAGEFSFSIAGTDSDTVKADEANQKLANGDKSFQNVAAGADAISTMAKLQNVSFDQDDAGKTFSYIVDETTESGAAQVSYDKSQYRVDIQVVDNGDGSMHTVTTVTQIKDANGNNASNVVIDKANSDDTGYTAPTFGFTNDYNPKPATVGENASHQIQVKKTVTGADSATDYTFTLTATGDNIGNITGLDKNNQLTVKTDGTIKAGKSQTKTFGDLTFSEPGTYTFTVQENQPAEDDGWTFGTDPQTVTVHVTDRNDDGEYDGNLYIASVTGSPVEITNSYNAEPVIVGGEGADQQITVRKSVTGKNPDGNFNFKIEPVDPDDGKWQNVEAASDDFDAQTTVSGVTTEQSQTASFAGIKFKATGEYKFKITEVEAHDETADPAGWTYDTHESFATVKVTDNGEGQLEATVTYDNSQATTDADRAVNNAAAFTNSYTPDETTTTDDTNVDTNILVTKQVTGAPATEAFKFTLKLADGQSNANVFEGTGDDKTPFDGVEVTTSDNLAAGDTETKAFAGVTFTAAGDYKFVIDETTTTDKAGWTYDGSTHEITVHVADQNAKLVITGIDDNNPKFTNSYTPNEVTTDGKNGLGKLQVTKVVTGAPATQEFNFNLKLTSNNADGVLLGTGDDTSAFPNDGITASTTGLTGKEGADAQQTLDFSDLTFTKTDIYTFQVTETDTAKAGSGWTYGNGSGATITVTVTDDNFDGQLDATTKVTQGEGDEATEIETNNPTITNAYAPGSVTVGEGEASGPIQVTKNISGTAPAPSDFSFTLTFTSNAQGNTGKAENIQGLTDDGKGNLTLTTSVSQADLADGTQTANFGKLTFTATGDYYFTVAETTQATPDSGWTYDNSPKTVIVHVTDEGHDGQLDATVDDDAAVVTNTYKANEVTVGDKDGKGNLAVTKKVIGAPALSDFDFQLKLTSDNASHVKGLGEGNTLNVSTTGLEGKEGDDATQKVTFDPLTFDAEGTYTLEVTETTTTDKDGWTYASGEDNAQTITVVVTDEGHDGQLDATTVVDGNDTNNPTFTNSYKASSVSTEGEGAIGNLQVTKEVTGNSTDAAFSFTATLTSGNAANVLTNADDPESTFPDDGITASTEAGFTDGQTKAATFDNLTFTAEGDYTFKVVENGQTPTNWTYATGEDNAKTITIHVTDTDHDGKLEASYDEKNANNPTFTNTYRAEGELPGTSETEADLTVTKTIDGRNFQDGDAFTFTLTADENNPAGATLPDNAGNLQIAYAEGDNTATKSANFDNIKFTLPGTYTFYVSEQQPAEGTDTKGVTYSTEQYTVTVEVTDAADGNGKLNARITSIKNAAGDDVTKSGMVFTNTYNYTGDVTLDGAKNLTVTKELKGRDWQDGDSFTFTLSANDGTTASSVKRGAVILPENAGGLTITNETEGHKAAFGDITFTEEGEYSFKIIETKGDDAHMTYDGHARVVTVKVTDNKQGKLVAEIVDDKTTGSGTFTNVYTPSDEKSVSSVVDKVMTEVNGKLVGVGDTLEYDIDWANNAQDESGAPKAAQVIITDTIPQGTALVEDFISNNGQLSDDGTTITWTIDAAAAETGTVSFRVTVTDDAVNYDSINNKASISIDGNSHDTNVVENDFPKKEVADETPDTGIQVGDTLDYTIEWANHEGTAQQVTITDTLPAGLTYVDGSADPADDFKAAGQTLTWNLGEQAAGAEGTVTFKAKVNESATTVEDPVTNQATVTVGDNSYKTNTTGGEPEDEVKTGNLSVSKEIKIADGVDADIDTNKSFSFTISLKDTAGNDLTGSYKANVYNEAGDQVGPQDFIVSGVDDAATTDRVENTFTLKHGEHVVISGLPEGATYTVTEADETGYEADEAAKDGAITADGATAAFTNTYNPGSTTTDDNPESETAIKLTKTVTGAPATEEFGFALTPTEDYGDAVSGLDENGQLTVTTEGMTGTESSQTIAFGKLTFSKKGDYTFNVTETNADPAATSGWTYDNDSPKQITVHVTDDLSGTLKIASIEGNNPTFENKYKAGSVVIGQGDQAGITVSKTLSGRDWQDGDSFTFTLAAQDNAPMPAEGGQTVTIVNADEAKAKAFGAISYDAVGEYHYTVTETKGNLGGVTYDTHTANVTVKVTDEGNDGQLDAVVIYDNSQATTDADKAVTDFAVFTNTYQPGGDVTTDTGEASAQLTKVLQGKAWNGDAFTFQIAPNAETPNAPLPEQTQVTVDGPSEEDGNSATFKFGPMTYDAEGTYKYDVTEVAGTNTGMDYDGHTATVTVKVTDNKQGGYAASVTIENGTFTNVYSTELDFGAEGQGGLWVVKNLENHDIAEGQFEFTVTAADEASAKKAGFDGMTKVIKSAAGTVDETADGKQVATSAAEICSDATFTQDDADDTYTYTVRETKGGDSGYANDQTTYTVKITTADDGNGGIRVTTHVTADNGYDQSYVYDNDASTQDVQAVVPFNNAYTAEGTLGGDGEGATSINAAKQLSNRDQVAGEFTFNVTDANGTTVSTGTNAADGSISFSPISYTKDQLLADAENGLSKFSQVDGKDTFSYQYTVAEDTSKLDEGVTAIAGSFQITVTVTDNNDGTLDIAVTYPDGADGLTFRNAYGEGEKAQATINVNGSKKLDVASGNNAPDIAGKYTFTLTGSEGAPMPSKTTTTNDAAGNVNFGDIKFTMENVFGDDGTAAAEPEAPAADEATDSADGQATDQGPTDEADGSEAAAEDSAAAAEGEDVLIAQGEKDDAGADGNAAEDASVAAQGTEPVPTQAAFRTTASAAEAKSAKRTKTFTYTVTESGQVAGVANDPQSRRTFTVTVTDNGDGTLSVATDPAAGDKFSFTNTYSVQPTDPTEPTDPNPGDASGKGWVSITKQLSGRDLAEGEFQFALTGIKGTPSEGLASTGTNAADGSVTLGDGVVFDEPGTYEFTIAEVAGDKSGVTYDPTAYVAVATVTDNGDGTLAVSWKVTDAHAKPVDEITFKNAYEIVRPATVTFGASKALEGAELAEGQFSFELKDADGKVLQTAKNAADGSVVFEPMSFKDAGTYVFTVSEALPADDDDAADGVQSDGVTYDETVYTATVTVVDNGDGSTSASVAYDGGELPSFTNAYEEPAEPEPAPEPEPGKPEEPGTPAPEEPEREVAPTEQLPTTGDYLPMVAAGVAVAAVALVGGGIAIRKRQRHGEQ